MASFTWNVAQSSAPGTAGVASTDDPSLLPRDIALVLFDDDNLGDLDVVGGDLRLNSGAEGVAQAIYIGLGTWLGEWFLDRSAGTDYPGRVFVKAPDPVGLKAHFRERILSRTGVGEVPTVDASIDTPTRSLTVAASALTDFGEITIELADVSP